MDDAQRLSWEFSQIPALNGKKCRPQYEGFLRDLRRAAIEWRFFRRANRSDLIVAFADRSVLGIRDVDQQKGRAVCAPLKY